MGDLLPQGVTQADGERKQPRPADFGEVIEAEAFGERTQPRPAAGDPGRAQSELKAGGLRGPPGNVLVGCGVGCGASEVLRVG